MIVITEICKAPTPRLKVLNQHNTHNAHPQFNKYIKHNVRISKGLKVTMGKMHTPYTNIKHNVRISKGLKVTMGKMHTPYTNIKQNIHIKTLNTIFLRVN